MLKLPRFWRSPNEAIVFVVLALLVLGTLNIFSASFVKAGQGKEFHDSYYFVKRQLLYIGLGAFGALLCWRMDYRKFKKFVYPIAGGTLLSLALVPWVGLAANGAKRWISLGPLGTFQPSEVAKLAAVLLAAQYLARRVERGRMASLLSVPIYFGIIAGAFVFFQPDMGTAVIVVGMSIILYLIAGIPKQQLVFLLVVLSVGLVKLSVSASYRAERIQSWLNPWNYEQGIGYQAVQSLLAIGSGGFFGSGLGLGASKFYYLPEAHTDFAFAVWCQEAGFAGAAAVLFLFGLFTYYGGLITRRAPDGFGKMVALGMTTLIAGQAIINVGMVSGLLPVVGVPLPFISYGGTALLVEFAAVGLLLSVGRRGVEPQEEFEAPPVTPRRRDFSKPPE